MIEEIRLESFKRFQDLTLKSGTLTVLTGSNGGGKTSILHSLLLARQMARHPDRSHVELNGVDTLELGGADAVINQKASSDEAAIEVRDCEGNSWRWRFRAESSDALHAWVGDDNPRCYRGALAGPAPQFCYLCADRLGPRDVLGASAVPVSELDVGPRGEFVAQVLASLGSSRVKRRHWDDEDSSNGIPPDLLHQTEGWMSRIVRPTQIDAEWFPNTSITRLRFKTPGFENDWRRAPNAGFGLSYALPIVVAALRAEGGGLLLVENPEAHLHPAGQSMIGGFLAQVAADDVQVFLETHSDHVLNGIRVAVAEGRAQLSPDQVVVHFFKDHDGQGEVHKSMELSRTGQLSDWPAGFFDQTEVDLAVLASRRRRSA